MTLNTPSGNPARANSSADNIEAEGSFSDGFNTNVFPQAMAIGYIHMGTMAGKLNGVIPTATPSGWRMVYMSTPEETFSENSPFNRCGMLVANSITSSPRLTSPRASGRVLPCSAVSSLARSSWCRSTSSLKAKRIFCRLLSEVSRHPGNASRAASTAQSTSPAVANDTSAAIRPVAGLYTFPVRSVAPPNGLLLIQCSMFFIAPPQMSIWLGPRARYIPSPREPR